MAFRSAQQARVYIGILGASAYARSVSTDATMDVHDTTTLADTTKQFIGGQSTTTFSIAGPLDDSAASNGQWDALTDQKQSTTPVPITYMPLGTDGSVCWLMDAIETNFGDTSGVGSSVDWSMSADITGQPDMRGVVLENNTTITDTENGSSNDLTAQTTNGGVAHLHVTAFATATSDTVTIEDSSTGSSGWATIATFTAATGVTSERVEITGTVKRYLRVVYTVVGGPGSITRHVSFSRRCPHPPPHGRLADGI
jgi:hypothetical protein